MLASIIDHLWQSTLIVIGAGAATVLLRRHAARWRYWLWFAASMKFLVPFALLAALGAQFAWRAAPVESTQSEWQLFARQVFEPSAVLTEPDAETSWPQGAPPAAETSLADTLLADLGAYEADAAAASSSAVGTDDSAQASHWRGALPIAVLAAWLLGTLVILGRWATRWLWLHQMTRQAKPLTVVPIGERSLEVRSCPSIMEPGVFGILRPVLLIPEGIVDRLTPGQLEAIVAHERVHIERRDNLTASLHMLVEALFWVHPRASWIA